VSYLEKAVALKRYDEPANEGPREEDKLSETRDRLARLHEQFMTEANQMIGYAEDRERDAEQLRIRAAGLRKAAEGIGQGIEAIDAERAKVNVEVPYDR
jgi:hypothetical protein